MSWLKDRWEEVTAQVKMGDNQTASTVRAARAKAAPATTRVNTNQPGWSVRKPQSAPLTTQQRVNQSYGPVGFSGFKNYLKDYVDNNTEADRIRRAATTGLNESYDQEQDRLTKQAQASNDKLGTIHQVMKSVPAGVAEFVGKTPGSIGQMQGRVAKTVNDINNPVLRTGAKALTAPFGGLMTDKQADYNIKFGQGLNSRVQNKLQQSAFGDRADDNKWVTGAGKMVGQLGGQIATGGLGTAAIGSQMAADEANKAQAAGKSNTYSTLTGLGQGGIGALSEKFGVDRFLPGNNVTGNTVTKLLKRGLTEGTQEVQQQFTQNLIANKAYNPEQGLKDGLAESFVMGGLAGGAMSPAVDIMNRPTAPKPTTSLVAPKPEPTRTRLRPEEARIWSDYQETLYKGNRMPAQVVNETHNKARQIADSLGVDIITGSPDEIAGRMNPLLEQSMAFQKEPTTGLVRPKPLNQGGYVQLPGIADPVVNQQTGETLSQSVEKLQKFGWSDKDIQNYKNTVLGVKDTTPEIQPYKLQSSELFHGTHPDSAKSILQEGFKSGNELPENAYRGGGYDAKQGAISFSIDPKIASRFATVTSPSGTVIHAELKPSAKVVTVKGIDYAEDLNDRIAELRKKGVDAVYIDGEKEVAVINPSAVKTSGRSKTFKSVDAKNTDFTDLGNKANPKSLKTKLGIKPLNEGGYVQLPGGKDVDPLESLKQEARKYKSADEFADSLNAMKYGKVTGVGQLPVSKINKTQIKALTERGLPHTDTNLKVSDFKPGRQVTQPLEVYSKGGSWVVENGNHRLAQALANGDETVPVVFKGGEGKKYSTPITDLYNQAHSQPTAKPEAPQATAAKPDAETKFPGLVDDLMQANSTADVMAIYQKYGIPVDQGTADVTYRYKDNKNQLDAVTADMQTADEIRKASVVGTYTVKEQGDYLLSRDLPKRYIDGKNIPKYSGTESEFTVEIPKRGGDLVLVKNDKGTIFSETLDSAQSKYGTTDPELLANRMINGKKAEIVKKADPLEAPKTEAPQPTPDPTAALKQEALKYKSAEEFVKAQGEPLYHGSPNHKIIRKEGFKSNPNGNNLLGEGVYMTRHLAKAENYSLPSDLPRGTTITPEMRSAGVVEGYIPKGSKIYQPETRAELKNISTKELQQQGFDGIEINGETVIFDQSKIKTREQLTDLYNQATQPPKSTASTKTLNDFNGNPVKKGDTVEVETIMGTKTAKVVDVTDGRYPEVKYKLAEDLAIGMRDPIKAGTTLKTRPEMVNQSTPKTVEAKPPTPFEKDLQTAGLAPKKAKGLVVSETKPLNGQKIQKVRTAPGEVEQRVVQDRSDEIADALGIPAKDRVPTTDSQRAERVDTAAQNGLENIKNNPEIVRQAAAPSTLKDKTKRKTFEEATKKYLGGTRSAEIERQATIASLNKEFKLSDKEKINAIISRDDPSVPALNEKVMRYNDRFKQLTDVAYKSYTDQGVKMGYVSSYLPRIYKNPKTGQEVDLPEFKALIQGSKRMKGREAEKVAVDWLVEKDPTKLLERYYKSMDNAVAGRQYMKDLEDNGLVTASTEPVRGMRPVIAEGLQTDGKVFYAQKDVAHKLNELFGSKEATNLVEKTLEKGAGVNSLFQSFVLSGGVPNTPINAFGMMQLLKEGMALHPIKAGRAFFGGGLSKSYANKVFTAKKDIMKLMVENDLDIRVNLEQTGKWGNKRIRDAFKNEGKAAGLNQAWNEFTNDATFGRFMPMLEVLHFENVYKHQLKGSLIRKPKSPAEAARIAADSTKNFYGKTSVYKTSTRSKAVDDAAGALLFAPRFRESMVNFWVKNAKTFVPTNTLKPEYRDNLKFMAASAAMYAAMTMLNEAMNGARMDENPDGKKDKLIMPASVAGKFGIDTKGKDIAVPFLPSIATVPRNLASLGANLATGKFNEAGKNAKAFASMPVKTVGDILTNEDYFGNKIVQDDSSPLQKFTQAASYVASSNMQPWIREALNVKGQKWDKETKKTWGIKEKSTFETLSNAGELPLRFYKPDTYRYGENWTPKGGKDEKFNFKQQRERAALGGEIKNISKTLKLNKRQDELFKSLSSVEFNDDGTLKEDNNPFYKSQRYTALQDDGVFEAMKQKSKLNAKLNGKPIDPIFSDDLAPDQRRVLLWKKTLPPGTSDPTVKKLYEQDWYQDYRNKESAYFDSKKAWNKKMGYKDATPNTNEYPVASKEVEDAQNAYFALPKGTGDRSSFIRNNPEIWNKMIAFWDSKDAWTNGERSKLGLGAVDDEDSGGFSYGSKRSSKRGGRGSKGGSKYDYTKNLFASSSDSASTSKQLRAILEKAMSGKS